MLQLILLLSISSVLAASRLHLHPETVCDSVLFELWQDQFNVEYPTAVIADYRFNIFCQNVEKAKALNRRRTSETEAEFGLTQFSDLNEEEFVARTHSYGRNKVLLSDGPWCGPGASTVSSKTINEVDLASLAPAIDWRQTPGVVGAVRNQGGCNGCYGFSAVETIESAWALAGHDFQLFSVQQVLSCSPNNTFGCEGGFTECVYNDIAVAEHGLMADATFPFTCVGYPNNPSSVPPCINGPRAGGYVTGYQYVLPPCYDTNGGSACNFSTTVLQQAVMKQPVSSCLDNTDWQNYKGGVLTQCSNYGPGHCVQIVGYNTTAPIPYWLVRNSYGTSFGEEGYIRIAMDPPNLCGLGDITTIPLFN